MSKKAIVEKALAELGDAATPAQVAEHLEKQGQPVSKQYVYQIKSAGRPVRRAESPWVALRLAKQLVWEAGGIDQAKVAIREVADEQNSIRALRDSCAERVTVLEDALRTADDASRPHVAAELRSAKQKLVSVNKIGG